MKKKYIFVLISLVLLFMVFSGFIPYSFFRGIESPIFLQNKILIATQQEGQKLNTGLDNVITLPKGGPVDAVTGYTFSQTTTTYTPAYTGTLLCNTSCDDQSYAVTLPFTFTYNGVAYTTLAASNNGYIQMGTSSVSGYTPICTGTYFNIIAPFAYDLMGNVAAGDSLRYLTTGTTPNRVFTIEWSKWGLYNSGSPYNELDFEIKLFETTNIIQFVYKPETPTLSMSTMTCGLSGATTTDYNLRTNTSSWTSTTAGTSNCAYMTYSTSNYPPSGLTFIWTPPYIATGNMGYVSSNTIKLNAGAPVQTGSINNQMIQVQVVDTGVTSPFIINKLKIGLNGTNNPSTDIQNAKLWYTRSSSTFAMTRQYGSTVSYPTGAYYFTDTATLDPNATNYFWLTFDISAGAVSGDSCNASCDSIFATSPMGNVVPTVTSPPGANLIDAYCLGTYTNVGLPYGLYITNVTFGSINNTTGCPGTLPYVYSRYTNLSTVVRQNNPYPIIVVDQNTGNPNACAFGIWVDWNNNNSFLDPGEWYPTTVIPANTTTVATATINVPSNATIGSHRMRIRANLSTAPAQSTICGVLTYGEQEDYTVNVLADTNMTYSSSTTTQTNFSNIFKPATNQQIIGVQVVAAGNVSPLSTTSFTFSTNGSTNPVTDISNAKLWATGLNPTFATNVQIGATFNNPNGTFTIPAVRQLSAGTNYFWLTYDVLVGATTGDSVDAQCNSIVIAGVPYLPTVSSPPGNRVITSTAMCGTYTIPGSYPSIAAAITDLNSQGTVTCPIVFNVAANYVEVASNLTITATGTAVNTVTFQKSGTGANPCVVAGVGTGTYDGIIKLYGTNYFTFDGIDVRDTSSNTTTTTQMEWGYALLRPDGNHGDQFNTIKNCNISLNKTNTASYGIYSYYMTTAGVTNTPLSVAGTNSNNSFLNLNISNCYNGYYLYSYVDGTFPFSLADANNIISTTGGGRSTVTNFGGSTVNAYGIYAYYQNSPTITNTYINSRGGTTQTGYIYGIYNYAYYCSGNNTVSNDTVSLVDTIGSTGYLYGIHNDVYYANNNYVTNNVITGCVNYTSSYYSYYLYNYCYGGASYYVKNNYCMGNKVIGNTFGNPTATTTYTYDYYNYGYASGKNYFYNNLDSGNVVLGTTAYCNYQLYNYGIADSSIINKNRFVNNTVTGTTTTATHYGIYDYYYQSYLYHQLDSNVIADNTCASTSSESYYCVYQYTGSAYTDISNNTVSGNKQNGTGTLYSLYINYYTAPPIGSTFNVTNNQLTNQQKLTATGTGTIYGLYYSNPVAGTVNLNNNTISGFTSAAATTMYGLYQASSPSNILNVNNNKIYNLTTGGASTIYGLYNTGTTTTQATVSQDSIYNLTSLGGTIYSMYIAGGNPVNVYKNRIYGNSSTTGTGGVVYGIYVSSGTIVNLFNNFVSDLKAPASTSIAPAIAGIYLSGGTYHNVYYNTVYLNATSTATSFGTAALYASTSPTGIDLRNNIFVDASTPGTSSGLAVAFRRSSTGFTNLLTSNNNCFYAGVPSANHLIFYDGTNSDQTLALYKTRSVPRDNNSVTEMPTFINVATAPYDLHINTTTPTQLESGGQTIAAPPVNITDDGFGTARFPNSGYPVGTYTPKAPDIGAHEFGGVYNDIVPPTISYTPLGIGGTANRQFNNVIITDNSGVNTASGTRPRCYYKRSTDGTSIGDTTSATDGWKWVEANGTTSPFDFTIIYSRLFGGTGVAAGTIIQYFVVAQDLAGTPNFAANQATFATAPTSVALTAANTPIANYLTYTIGTNTFAGNYNVGSLQTYTSLTGAAGIFAAINAGTVTGDITISITSDMLEDGTNQLNALNETGIGKYKVKIVPSTASMKTISGWVTQAMIRLNGVRRVTIDGNNGLGAKYLTFRNMSTSYPTIQFQNETGVDTVKNCYIESNNIGTASGTIYFSTTTLGSGIGNDSICVNSCDIRSRTDTVAANGPANGIYSLGTSTTLQTYNNFNSIINCNIYDYFYDAGSVTAGIFLTSYNSNWNISGNSFYQTVARTIPANSSSFCGIYSASTLNNDINITNNYFGGTAPACGSTAMTYTGAGAYNIYGIYLSVGLLAQSSIQGNTFQNVNLTTSPAASSSVFYRPIYASSGFINIGNLSGNTIGSGTGTGNITLTTNTSTSTYTIALLYHTGIGAVMNNTIGSITFAGNSTGTGDLYAMIYYSNTTYGQIYTISNNLIGSLTTANSIQVTNNTNYHAVRGLYLLNGAGTTNYYTNNIVSNLTSFSTIGTNSTYLVSIYGIQHNSASVASPCFFTGNTVRYLTVNQNIAYSSYALLGIGASGYDFNTLTNNYIYGLYSNGTGAGTPLMGAMLLGGLTGGLCSQNKIYDFRYAGTGSSNPYPLILGLNCQSYGEWKIVNNMVSFTNGEVSEKIKQENLTFKQVRVENPPINKLAIPKEINGKIEVTPVKEGPLNPGLYDESRGPVKDKPIIKNNNSGKDETRSTSQVTIAACYHTNNAYKGPVNYYNNSFYVGGSVTSVSSFNSYAFVRTGNGLLNLTNNAFVNARTGGGGYHYCIANEGSIVEGWPANSSNYNLLIGATNTIGEWGTGNFQTYEQWIYSTSGDFNSVWDTPSNLPGTTLYRSIGTGDLNIDTTKYGATYIYQKGIGSPQVTNDYNGYPRATSGPICIGAHEFILNGNPRVVLLTPANNAVNVPKPVSMVWRKALFATGYRIQIAKDSLFNVIVVNTNVSDSTYSFTTAVGNTNYFWRVNPVYTSINGLFSLAFKFTTVQGLPNAPVLISPPNNAINQPFPTLTFTWGKAIETKKTQSIKQINGIGNKDNTESILKYWYDLVTDSASLAGLVRDSALTDTTKLVSTLTQNTIYFWRVRAKDEVGWGPFSGWFKFTTQTDPTALSQANFNAVIIPQIMSCGGTTRMPVVVRATLINLTPNKLYRFYNGGAVFTDMGTTAYGAGNPLFTNPDSTIYRYTTAASLTTAGGYDQFRANGSGTFTGWFAFVNTANARFAAGKYIIPSIVLGDSLGTTISRFAMNDSIKVVNFSSTVADTCGTGIYGISVGFPKNIISLYDNITGTGKPLSQTYLESEGVTIASIAPFYTTYVEGLNGRWGAVIPNVNANGVRRVEQRNLATGNSMIFNTDADGTWPSGAITVNPTGGLTPVGLLLNDAPLLDYPLLVTPINNATSQPLSLTLNWNTVTYASSYRVQLATDSLFATIVKDSTLVPDSLYVTGLLGLQNYWWRVAGATTTGVGPFGSAFKFTTMMAAPIAPTLLLPVNGATGVSLTPLLDWNDVATATSYRIQIASSTQDTVNFTTNTWDTTVTTVSQATVPAGKLSQFTKYYWRVNATNGGGTGPWATKFNFTTLALSLQLNLKVYLEGFWNGTTQVADTINIYLAASTSPYTLLDSQKVVLGTSGTVSPTPTFSKVSSGNYYIVVQHRNHLITWSGLPQTFVAGTPLSYDFTTDSTKAFGLNMKKVGSVWVLIVGDANQDGSIDATDVTDLLIPQYGNIGYLSCDFNGDGSVDAADIPYMIANYGLTKVVPSEPLVIPELRNQKRIIKQQELDQKFIKKTVKTNKNNNN
jgi:hypothetical protein